MQVCPESGVLRMPSNTNSARGPGKIFCHPRLWKQAVKIPTTRRRASSWLSRVFELAVDLGIHDGFQGFITAASEQGQAICPIVFDEAKKFSHGEAARGSVGFSRNTFQSLLMRS